MKKAALSALFFIFAFAGPEMASAHFGMAIPSDSMVMQKDDRRLKLSLSFSHPFEGIGMDMQKPEAFGVFSGGKSKSLLGSLRKTKIMDAAAWSADYSIKRPGAHVFYMEPKPYWEASEDCFIIHYTKTVAAAFGDDEGWDREIGLKTELVPLSKPYGLYAGNIFQAIVKMDGKIVPYAGVEVEFYNREKQFRAPTDYMIAQTVRADKNGLFSYAAPWPGWWGFAALNMADYKIRHKEAEKDVELGAVIWVRFHEWK